MQFLGQLFRLSDVFHAKHMFNSRHVCYLNYDKQTSEFILNIKFCAVLQKYVSYGVIDIHI
jgi:hypothetical protein